MSRKTVQKHIGALVDKGLIQTENTTVRWKDGRTCNGNLLYTITPVGQVLKEREKELLAQLKVAEAQRKWAQRQGAVVAKALKPLFRVVSPFVHILRVGKHPYTSEGLKRGVARLVAHCWPPPKEIPGLQRSKRTNLLRCNQ